MPEQETIWIIGASDGIGAALARLWSKQGVRLILSARSESKLQTLVSELGAHHIAIPVDVSNRESLEQAAEQITAHAPIDRIIHLAANYDPGSVLDADPLKAGEIVTTNLTGSFHVAQIAPRVLRRGGQLALCGSVAGYFGLPQGQIYSATKAGVINLAESLRSELEGVVDVRLICPGFVDTRLTKRNDFTMPALISSEKAAHEIISGLNKRRFEVHFPRRLTLALKLLRALPYWAALPLAGRLTQRKEN
ncbi:SDR family NAD(P)-dependent oxidoreductase [Falsihalocynthiibacter sp. SS001]|uniref:SDR family NAD(P)-dependent oxidoreductase n=1 Tax=Falsihalocynthiibacter sp. SS001 TaxID=3349698 RepID=UPI0036D36B8E